MKLDLGKIKAGILAIPTKLIPKKKRARLSDEDIEFIQDNIECFKYFVKYEVVFKALVKRISEREVEALNKEKPCRFRQTTDIPFIIYCDVKEMKKGMNECDECKSRVKE